ncbi:MAG TPA: molybdopterin-binding protein, partial [Kofleriaceae bacterium]|nr:molybdopterin-binding protein [Kofleriaceae bacterium]
MSSPPVHLAVLVVASDPAKADLATAMVIRGRATTAGHPIVAQNVTKVMEAGIRSQLARWIDDPDIDVILITGAVEKEEVAAAIKPLVTQRLEGFTDLFRYLAFQEMGAGAMLSTAEAAQCNSTYVFVLPGSVGAVGTAMDKLIIPQLDPNTQPKNLVSSMPGPKKRADAVPAAIPPEKTQGGSGVAPKVPARGQSLTGKNVVRRAQDDPPTKQIDVARLEQQIALSERTHDAQTKPNIDLRKMLPRVPPGADEAIDTDTDVELLAAPPAERGVEKRLDTSPVIPPPRPAASAIPSIKGNAFNQKERTSPGTAPPRPGTDAKPPGSLKGIEGDAFNAKEGTSPGAAPVTRSRPMTGPRPRPISVPPTNAFGAKEDTSRGTSPPSRTGSQAATPNTRTHAPSGSVPAGERARAPSSPPPVPVAARTREPSQPDPSQPPAREWKRQFVETPAVPMPVTRLPYPSAPSKPVSSGMLTPPSSSIFAAAAKGADEAAGTNGATAVGATTPAVEAAPTIDAAELEPAEVEEEAAPPPRTREPTPPPPAPPPRAATAPPVAPPTRAATAPPAVAKAKPASFDDVVSTPTRTSGELPV